MRGWDGAANERQGLVANDYFSQVPAEKRHIALSLAGYLPTRRAIRVDPTTALRHE